MYLNRYKYILLQVNEANEVPISSLIWSLRRHSNSFKFFSKIGKKLKYIFMTVLRLAESFKTMNWPDPNRTDHNAF